MHETTTVIKIDTNLLCCAHTDGSGEDYKPLPSGPVSLRDEEVSQELHEYM